MAVDEPDLLEPIRPSEEDPSPPPRRVPAVWVGFAIAVAFALGMVVARAGVTDEPRVTIANPCPSALTVRLVSPDRSDTFRRTVPARASSDARLEQRQITEGWSLSIEVRQGRIEFPLDGLYERGVVLIPALSCPDEATVPPPDWDTAQPPPEQEPAQSPAEQGTASRAPRGSSPATFDPDGWNAVYLVALDVDSRRITFDVIQWLSGDDAVAEYRRQNPDDPTGGPPNDYMILNTSRRERSAQVAREVAVRLVRLREDGSADLDPATFEELPRYLADYAPPQRDLLSHSPFWLLLRDGVVVEIEERYTP